MRCPGWAGFRRTPCVLTPLLIALCHGAVHTDAQVLPVVPAPRVVEWKGSPFSLMAGGITPTFPGVEEHTATLLAEELLDAARPSGAEDTFAVAGRKGSPVMIGLPDRDPAFLREVTRIFTWPDPRIGDEGYLLDITRSRVLIAARTERGLFYGVQTLKQLARGGGDRRMVAGVRVIDWPDFRYRGILDDISRGPVPTPAYFREQIRRCAELKLNLITYYTENVVATQRHGEFAPAGGALTISEWKELAAFAKRYHVDIVGNFQSFGHAQQLLAHPRYAPLGEAGSLLSPVNEGTYTFLREVYEEMIPAFQAPFFSVDADETFDLGKEASRKRVDSLGRGVVYAEHILRLHRIVTSLGPRMLIWGDILLEHPDVIPTLPRDILIGTWTYDALENFDRYIVPFRSAGFEVFVCPGVLNSSKVMPDFRQTFGNIRTFVADGKRLGAIGVLNCVWDDGGSALFARDWYGVAFGGDHAWRSDPGDTTFDGRFALGVYGDRSRAFPRGIRTFQGLSDLGPTDGMNERILWVSLLPDRGQRQEINLTEWDRVRELAAEADSILRLSEPTMYSGDRDVFLFTAAQYRVAADTRFALVEASRLYRDACLEQRADPHAARAGVVRAIAAINGVRQNLDRIRSSYQSMWLRENRVYALDRILSRFDDQLQQCADVEKRLLNALADLDRGIWLPVPGEVRLWIEENNGWYFREWLVAGPIAGADLRTDALAAMGGERSARPAVTQEFTFSGATYRWRRFVSEEFARVDPVAGPPVAGTLYAVATLESPDNRRVRALAGSDGGIVVFVNGAVVHRREGARTFTPDEDEFLIPLTAGRNHVMVKMERRSGTGGFSLRLPDSTIRNRKNRYRLLP